MKKVRLPNSAATGPERTALRIVRELPAADQRLREQLLGSRRGEEAELSERLTAIEARLTALEELNAPPLPLAASSPEDHAWAAVSRSVCAAWSCAPDVLHSTAREADLVLIRHTAIWLLHRVWGTPQRVLAKRFRVTIGTINWAVQRVEERRTHPDWTHFQNTLNQLIAEQRAADLKPRSSAALPPQTPDARPELP